jgi:uncharacterized protein YaiI (UPF0178 family)
MKVWIDADACPVPIRDIVLRAAHRLSVHTVFVANKPVPLFDSPFVTFVQVVAGADVADRYIEENAKNGDLVVTQDIPLAALLVPMGVTVISPRGDSYNTENIGDVLARRNLLDGLREIGSVNTTQRPFDDTLKRQFSNLFDAKLQALLRQRRSLDKEAD